MTRTYQTSTYDHTTRQWTQTTIVTTPDCVKCDDYGVTPDAADGNWYCDCAAGDGRRDDDAAGSYYDD